MAALAGGARTGAAKPPPVPTVKVTVSHQAPTSARAMAGAAAALGKAASKSPAAQPQQPQKQPLSVFSPNMSDRQLLGLAQQITGRQSQAQLIPLRQQAAQLQNQQQTAQTRMAGYGQTDQGILSGLQASQNASALTNENAQAQAAQNTANQIDQSGQAAASLNAGSLGPEAQAALANTRQFQGTTQGAQAGYLAGQMGNNADLLTALRGTAALQAQEGQGNIQSAYGKLIGTNAAAQQAVIAKLPAATAAEAATLGQQRFSDQAIAKEFNLKGYVAKTDRQRVADAFALGKGQLAIGAENAGTAATNAQTRLLGVKGTIAYQGAMTALKQAGLTEKTSLDAGSLAVKRELADTGARHERSSERIAAINVQLKKQGLSETKRAHLVTERRLQEKINASTAPGSKSSKTSTTYIGLIAGYASLYEHLVKEGAKPENAAGEITKRAARYGGASQAAIDIATQGYVSAATVQQLKAQGVTLPASMTTPPPAAKRLPAAPTPKISPSLTTPITAPIGG